jgi:hypothetical protein
MPPTALKVLQEHAEVVAEHGHSHGVQEDLYWALHGHSPDVVDHDHSQALLTVSGGSDGAAEFGEEWRLRPSSGGSSGVFRIERPPRV